MLRLWLQIIVFILTLLGGAIAAQASPYYWVPTGTGPARTGNGVWNELGHWASTSGGPGGAYSQVPQSTDDVYFDANSFTGNNQRVSLVFGTTGTGSVPTCRNLTWSGNVRGATFIAPGVPWRSVTLEINGDLRYTATMANPQVLNYQFVAADAGNEVDFAGRQLAGSAVTFDNSQGEWTFTGSCLADGSSILSLNQARRVSLGSSTVQFGRVFTSGSPALELDLGSSTLTAFLQWNITNPNLRLTAGTSTLQLGNGQFLNYDQGLRFNSPALIYNRVIVTAGTSLRMNAPNARFQQLVVAGELWADAALSIEPAGTLQLAADAVLRGPTGRIISFGSGASLTGAGSCAGLGTVRSGRSGQQVKLARAGGWADAPLSNLQLQDVEFTTETGTNGAAVATNSLDEGNNAGVTVAGLPTTNLYWVGGSGNWHDPAHWATTSGGPATSQGCVPNAATNVHFDAQSFTAAGQQVVLDGNAAACRSMNWTGAAFTPRLAAASSCQTLRVAGSLTFVAGMTQRLPLHLVVGSPQAGSLSTLTTAGQVLAGNVVVRAPGSRLELRDSLVLMPSVDATYGRVYVEAGTFNTGNQRLNVRAFNSGYEFGGSVFLTSTASTAPVALELGSSFIRITQPQGADVNDARPFAWDVTPGVQLNAGTSTLLLLPLTRTAARFRSGMGLRYATVRFADAPSPQQTPILMAGTVGPDTFEQLEFLGGAALSTGTIITGTMRLAPGRSYSLAGTHTFRPGATLRAVGTCNGYITMRGTARLEAATALPLEYVQLQNLTFAGGATWEARSGVDAGGNVGISFAAPVARTLYWVGNGGNWSDAAHWSLQSGGPGGACPPALMDDVVLDAQSFTQPGQTLVLDQPVAVCRSLHCADVVNNPTLSSEFSATLNRVLNVYGSVTLAPTSRFTLRLAGDVNLLGSGTITSAGQTFFGNLTVNVPGGTVQLADALQHRLTGVALNIFPARTLTLEAGTLTTNNQPVSVADFRTAGSTAKTLNLGSSLFEVNYQSWNAQTAPTLTLNAGTSVVYLNANQSTQLGGKGFGGGNQPYNRVVLRECSVSGNNTFRSLQLLGSTSIGGSNTIVDSLALTAGKTYRFTTGTTTTFRRETVILSPGTGSNPVTLQSNVPGSLFTWSKVAGGPAVCIDYTYIRDSRATGGAYFEAGKNGANNQGNNPGWSFGFPPRAVYQGRNLCPGEGPHTMRFTFAGFDITNNVAAPLSPDQFPLTMQLRNLTTGTTETVSVPTATFDYLIPTSTADANYQIVRLGTSASGGCGTIENTDATTFPVAAETVLRGTAGTWSGGATAADGNWFDCQNWANGTVPTSTTDVILSRTTTSVSLGSGRMATVPVAPALNAPAAAVRTLTIPAGASFRMGAAGRLSVAGDWVNNGSTTLDPVSAVSFTGQNPQNITNGQFGGVVVDNTAGLQLLTDATTSGTLTLTRGVVNTGTNRWNHTNAAPASVSGYGATAYVAGNLRRTLDPTAVATYGFPVGSASQYALLETAVSRLRGTVTLDARFGPKPGTDAGLTFSESATTPRYQSVHAAGVWTLTPDAQPTGGTYDVRTSLAPFAGLMDNRFAVLKRPDASTNAADWTNGGGTLNPDNGAGRRVADGYALRKGLTSFSQFGIGLSNASPLPVTLVYFGASRRGADAQLSWRTASEVNSAYFEVQGSPDGITWQSLATVAAAGTTATPQAYAHLDRNLARYGSSTVYYRLRQVDTDGTAHYSPVAAVALGAVQWQAQAYPTAFSTTLTAQLTTAEAGPVTLQLLDPLGRVLVRQEQAAQPGSQTLAVEGVAQVPAGVYFLLVRQGHHTATIRVVRQ